MDIDDDDNDVDRARGNKNKRTTAGDDENVDEQRRKGLAGKIDALKKKMMVLLNLPLPGQSGGGTGSSGGAAGAPASTSAIKQSGDPPCAVAINICSPCAVSINEYNPS